MPLSAQDVLVVFQDRYRFQQEFDPEVEPGAVLSFDTRVERWRAVCDLLPAIQLGQALNGVFGISCSDAEWQSVLLPEKRLQDVCNFISESGAMKADAGPMKLAGKDCEEAGVFLALRSMLAEAGLPVSGMRPSAKLGPLLDDHFGVLVDTLAKLAPGALPLPSTRCSEVFGFRISRVILISLTIVGLSSVIHPQLVGIVACFFLVVVPVSYGIAVRKTKDKFGSVLHIAGIETLADLCRFIVQFKHLTQA